MSSKKNLYSVQKIKNFIKQYPVLLIYQHNNLTVKQRIDLKKQLHSFPTIKILTVKNNIISRVFLVEHQKPTIKEKTKTLNFNNLLQGPVFLIGCENHEDIKNIWNIFKNSSNFLFLGGQSKNQIYTHLDIQKSIELNNKVYYELLNNIDQYMYYQIASSLLSPLYQNTSILSSHNK